MWSREWKGVEEDGRGGRRSNEPTSHGVVSTRAPLPLFSSFSSPLPTSLHLFPRPSSSSSSSFAFFSSSLSFSFCLSLLLSCPSPLYYSYFHARVRQCGSTLMYTFFPASVCALGRACNARDMQSLRGPREICRQHRVEERGIVLLLNFSFNGPRGNSRVTSSSRQELRTFVITRSLYTCRVTQPQRLTSVRLSIFLAWMRCVEKLFGCSYF